MTTATVGNRMMQRLLGFQVFDQYMQQLMPELAQLYDHLEGNEFDVLVEIGVAAGASLWMLSEFVKPGGVIIGIDSYVNRRFKTPFVSRRVMATLQQTFDATLIQKRSDLAFADVVRLLRGRTIDLLHIDGDHTYDGAKRDFENYISLMSPGGIIQMHDVSQKKSGVPRYWNELKAWFASSCFEFNTPPMHIAGIGVIHL